MAGMLIFALLVACGYDIASTHIVTSAHSDMAFLNCVNSLTNAVQNTLCPMYGLVGQYSMETILHLALDPREAESRSWEFRNNMKKCCTRPCSISELIAVC